MVRIKPKGQHRFLGFSIKRRNQFQRDGQLNFVGVAPFTLLCVLSTVCAVTIMVVLALTPMYTKSPGVTPQCTSDTFSSIFNTQEGTLPMGELSTENRIALQSGLNEYTSTQSGFSRCTIEVRGSDVDTCPSIRRILQKSRRQRREISILRRVRQTNNNCANQALTTSSVLNCGCTCAGVCLRKKAQQLNQLLRSASISIMFHDPITVIVKLTGIDIPTQLDTTGVPFSGTTTETASIPTTTSAMITRMMA